MTITPKFCSLCGQPLKGGGAVFKPRQGSSGRGLSVCHQCLGSVVRCPSCRTPVHESWAGPCPGCGAELPRCRACGAIIAGDYIEVNGYGPYCQTCGQMRPACVACGSLVAEEEGRALPDGHHVCSRCDRTAIYDEVVARTLFEQVKAITDRDLGLALNVPTPVYLVDRNQLALMAQHLDGDAQPLDQSLGFYLRQGRQRGIYVLLGLPQILLMRVLAHECAHAWQAEHNPFGGELLAWEGFAEWVAYKTLAGLGYADALRQMCARRDVYGDGLRWMLEIERARGVQGVLETGRRAKTNDK